MRSEGAMSEIGGVATCRASWICLQRDGKGLGCLQGEGSYTPTHDWQMATPCNLFHVDATICARVLHGSPYLLCQEGKNLSTSMPCSYSSLLAVYGLSTPLGGAGLTSSSITFLSATPRVYMTCSVDFARLILSLSFVGAGS